LDGDGRSEILFADGDGGQGNYYESARLDHFAGARLALIKDFAGVLDIRCLERPGVEPVENESILYVTPGPHPKFRVERRTGPCSR
jgi:hypothetical protein